MGREFRDKKRQKEHHTQAYRVDRWLFAKESLFKGETAENIADKLHVKAPTIYRYVQQLEDWSFIARKDGSFDIVMELVHERRNS